MPSYVLQRAPALLVGGRSQLLHALQAGRMAAGGTGGAPAQLAALRPGVLERVACTLAAGRQWVRSILRPLLLLGEAFRLAKDGQAPWML